MFNVTVINGKQVAKFLSKLAIVLVIVFVLTKVNANIKESKFFTINIQNSFKTCLNQEIPGIKNSNDMINKMLEEDNDEYIGNFTDKLFQFELAKIENKEKVNNENENNQNTNEENNTQQDEKENKEPAKLGVTTEIVTQNPIQESYNTLINDVKIKNETSFELTEETISNNLEINKENVLIFHTHTCESYTSSEKYPYEPTGNFRTTDLNFTVARVGDELSNWLTTYGFKVNHDTTYHDYPAYSGSYTRSLKTVQDILNSEPSDIIIDLHRDAIGSKSTYDPTVKIGEDYAAQLMFVIGTNGGGLEHPNWEQNLSFAVQLQQKANELYPGLFKPMIVRNSRYNQHLGKAATIIEVGSTGNTLEQCLTSMKYLSKVMEEMLKK